MLGRPDRERRDRERWRRDTSRHEAAATDQVEIRDLVALEIPVDHAGCRIGPHAMRSDLVAAELQRSRRDVHSAHDPEDPGRDVLRFLQSSALVFLQAGVTRGAGLPK